MPKFAANISLLFDHLPYLERFGAAAAAGFTAVEILFPYDVSSHETKDALDHNNLTLVLINAPSPQNPEGAPGKLHFRLALNDDILALVIGPLQNTQHQEGGHEAMAMGCGDDCTDHDQFAPPFLWRG